MRGRAIPLITCLILLGGLAAVALGQVSTPSPARAAAVRATGAFEISNSVDGEPIFAANGIAPGGAVSGKVTIEDSGSVPVALKLKRGALTNLPGVGGGILSGRLQLSVADLSQPGAPRTIYAGPLDSMPEQKAGELNPGESRTYQFIATLPDAAPSVQNALQSASTTVAYSWVAEEATGEEVAPRAESPGGSAAGVEARLDLKIPRILQSPGGGNLVTYIDCDAPCRISVRGRLRATAHGHHRTAKIRFSLKRPYGPGSRLLRIPIPRGMRNWLRRMPPPKRLKATLRFTAIGTAGGRDVVKKKARLRVRQNR